MWLRMALLFKIIWRGHTDMIEITQQTVNGQLRAKRDGQEISMIERSLKKVLQPLIRSYTQPRYCSQMTKRLLKREFHDEVILLFTKDRSKAFPTFTIA